MGDSLEPLGSVLGRSRDEGAGGSGEPDRLPGIASARSQGPIVLDPGDPTRATPDGVRLGRAWPMEGCRFGDSVKIPVPSDHTGRPDQDRENRRAGRLRRVPPPAAASSAPERVPPSPSTRVEEQHDPGPGPVGTQTRTVGALQLPPSMRRACDRSNPRTENWSVNKTET